MPDRIEVLQTRYTTIYAHKFSTDGNELAASDSYGNISLFKLSTVLSADYIDKVKLPHNKLKVTNSSLYTLENANDYLICAPLNEIVGYKWKDLIENKGTIKQIIKIKLPKSENNNFYNVNNEINSLVYDNKNETKRLYAGAGNGEIYCFDLETSQLIHKYEAHKDCIFQILLKNNSTELVSVSEDGQVKIWDLRSNVNSTVLKPYENSLCARPNLGKHINCVAVDDDNWLICGGGPKLSMWHMRSYKPMGVFEFNDDNLFIPNVVKIYDNQIITGGNLNRLMGFTFENKLRTEITTSTNCIYDVTLNTSSKANRILCVAGSGTSIDVCSNFSYKALTLSI